MRRLLVLLAAAASGTAQDPPALAAGPLLGGVGDTTAAVWLRTAGPCRGRVELRARDGDAVVERELETARAGACLATVRFEELAPDTGYAYRVLLDAGEDRAREVARGAFTTFGPAAAARPLRVVWGSCYRPLLERPAERSVFTAMAERTPDLVLFVGDFPYADRGRRESLRREHFAIRSLPAFRELTRSTPTYAIWDDHDFGPDDTDGDHAFAADALAAFREHWPNPAYGLPGVDGVFCSLDAGPVEVFLLDGRYHARFAERTMLGEAQFDWLVEGLRASPARYKLLVSGTPFSRDKQDAWGGEHYRKERKRLFRAIRRHGIAGVVAVSGDIHRTDVHRLSLGGGRDLYDFTSSPLANEFKDPPDDPDDDLLFAHGEQSMFCELDFHPASDRETALVFRAFSREHGLVHELRLAPALLGLR